MNSQAYICTFTVICCPLDYKHMLLQAHIRLRILQVGSGQSKLKTQCDITVALMVNIFCCNVKEHAVSTKD